MSEEQTSQGPPYQHVEPNFHDWPIALVNANREGLIEEVTNRVVERLENNDIHEILNKTQYLERIRLRTEPWKIDPKDEKVFWDKIKREVLKNTLNNQEIDAKTLKAVVERYVREIAGDFKVPTYDFARRALPFVFGRLLNTAGSRNFRRLWSGRLHLHDRIKLEGYTEEIRKLSKLGTVVLLPTHFSNLDSILIGWGLEMLGLPAFTYGAGLNLFNYPIFGYFMNRLGAYKVDRRKKNPVYLESLKTYSTVVLENGCHSLFFPGGTRSRSGNLEGRLKLGLLGTAFEAQKNIFKQNDQYQKKIFVVPLVISYHFVLEARSLIQQHLKHTGKENYLLPKDEFDSLNQNLKFLWQTFSEGSKVFLSFGKPTDLFGNELDKNGRSIDKRGEIIDLKDYFTTNGKIVDDAQRDGEYTKMLSEKIVVDYKKTNIVLSSHLMAFIGFKMLSKCYNDLELFGLLRLPPEDRVLDFDAFKENVVRVIEQLKIMVKNDQIKLSPRFEEDVDHIIEYGLKNMGVFHVERPLMKNEEGNITSENMSLLYYYHNRTEGYNLEQYIQ